MRKFFSVAFKLFAGIFIYLISMFAFVKDIASDGGWLVLAIFMVLAIVAMLAGLAVSGFSRWRRDIGIVLVSTAAISAFMLLTIACIFGNDEFLRLMPPDSMAMFSSYWTGGAVMLALAALGWGLLKSARAPGNSPA
ncbi:hypothetical protein [Janthinobacterium sp.]|uniref:hypothetical protein n=1 Tax=Janthinobacterium sp. TaxID=1871054 RepID=UPI00261D7135|nr:hypothetical protein [Janthinobacterium sp.]